MLLNQYFIAGILLLITKVLSIIYL